MPPKADPGQAWGRAGKKEELDTLALNQFARLKFMTKSKPYKTVITYEQVSYTRIETWMLFMCGLTWGKTAGALRINFRKVDTKSEHLKK
jgi:hypothetical protein